GARLFDDVVTIALRAVAGATLPLVNKSFTPDAAAGAITDGTSGGASDLTARGDNAFLTTFPYLGTPHSGFAAGTNAAWAAKVSTTSMSWRVATRRGGRGRS